MSVDEKGAKKTMKAVVGGKAPTPSLFDLVKKLPSKRNGIFLAVLILVIIGVLVVPKAIDHLTLYGKVGSQKITKAEVNKLAKESKPYTKEQIRSTLMDRALYREVAKNVKVSVTEKEIHDELVNRTHTGEPYAKNYLTIAVERDLLLSKIQEAAKGYSKGRYVMARFDQHYAGISSQKEPDPMLGDSAIIAKDKAYATSFINDQYDKIVQGASFDLAMQAEKNDPVIGIGTLRNTLHSDSFDSANDQRDNTSLVNTEEFKKALKNSKQYDVTQPFVIHSQPEEPGMKAEETAWLIVILDEKKDGISGGASKLIENTKSKIGYVIYD